MSGTRTAGGMERELFGGLTAAAPPLDATRPATILVADDSEAKRYVAARWLRQAGFRVVEATTGEETLARVLELPDLVVLDVRLPDVSGLEVCRRIKRQPATAHIPVLHLSAHAGEASDRVAGLDGGADAYLTHPVEPEELIATVRALLRVRHAEAALRQSEERYRMVARATNDVVWDWDLRTGEVRWNAAAATVFRYAANDIAPTVQWWYDHIHPDDRDRVVSGLRAVIDGRGEYWLDEYRVRTGDGGYATVFDRGFVAHDEQGEPVRMIGSMLDVTERKQAEEAQHFLADASSVLTATLDYEAGLRDVATLTTNRGVADVCALFLTDDLGVTRLHALRADDAILELRLRVPLAGTPASGPAAVVSRAIATGTAAFHADVRQATGDGLDAIRALGITSLVVAPMRTHDRPVGAVLLARTRPPRFRPPDASLARELAGRCALAVENGRLYEAAVIADRAKADFLAVMSHELRTPLNAIVGYSDLLLLGIPRPVPEESQQYLHRSLSCARHLLQLIEQILAFSRMEAGREEVRMEPTSVTTLVTETKAIVAPLAQEKGLVFTCDLDADAGYLLTDPAKARQILLNLLSNAVKFTAAGAIRLAVHRDADSLTFAVSDSGIGIGGEHLERIFDPFWQVEQKKTRTAGGSGLGLTISRRLAVLLGGDIVVESTTGGGSTFTLRLPLHPDPAIAGSIQRDTMGAGTAAAPPGDRADGARRA